MTELTSELLGDVQNDNGIKVIDFYADWCTSCVKMLPTVTKTAEAYEAIPFFKANVDNVGEYAKSLGVRNIPCLVVVEGDKIKGKIIGVKSKTEFVDTLNQIINS